MMRRSDSARSRCWLVGLVLVALVGAACGNDANEESGVGPTGADNEGVMTGSGAGADGVSIYEEAFVIDEEPQRGGSVIVGVESDTGTYLPSQYAGTQAAMNVVLAVYDPLMVLGADGDYHPYLAESLESNDDFTEWTLVLRPDVVFHDGTPLDADALETIFNEYLTAEGSRALGDLRDVERMEVVDDLTVRYVMSQGNASMPAVLSGRAGWPFSPTAAERLGEDFGLQPVGTGPFRYREWLRDSAFILDRNDDYWQEGMPYLDRLEVRPIPDEETRVFALRSGDVDAIHSARLSAVLAHAMEVENTTVYLGRSNSASGVIFQTEVPPVDDPRIRRALSYALFQEQLARVVAGDAAELTELRTQYYGRQSPYYSETVSEAWPTDDPEAARELLEEYMADPNRSDGRGVGEPVEIVFNYNAVVSLAQLAQAYAGMWEAVGFEVNLQAMEQAANIQAAIDGDFMASVTRQGGGTDPYIGLRGHLGDPEINPANYMQYRNDRVSEILEELRVSFDIEDRYPLIEELGLIMAEEVPNTWIGSDNEFISATSDLRGLHSWMTPDGVLGSGAFGSSTIWSQVWRAQ